MVPDTNGRAFMFVKSLSRPSTEVEMRHRALSVRVTPQGAGTSRSKWAFFAYFNDAFWPYLAGRGIFWPPRHPVDYSSFRREYSWKFPGMPRTTRNERSNSSHGLSVTTPNNLKTLLVVLQNDCRVEHLHLPHYGLLRIDLGVPVGSSLVVRFLG